MALPDKTQLTYKTIFEKVKEVILQKYKTIHLKKVMADFESALLNQIKATFSMAVIKGCWFHFNQAIMRKLFNLGKSIVFKINLKYSLIYSKGFKLEYFNNFDFKIWVRRFGALALLPIGNLMEAWKIIIDTILVPKTTELVKFIKYIVDVWIIGKKGSNFSPEVWNCHECIGHRTNNNLEGFHSQLNKDLTQKKPDIYTVIRHFKTIDSDQTNRYLRRKQYLTTEKASGMKKKDKEKEKKLLIIQNDFKE
jgi:hypothetical protein